jgi:hypothetical protein
MNVYVWQGHRYGIGQVRMIVAAKSKAAAARAAGESDPRRLFNLHETDNVVETQVALARPGVVHWVSMCGSDDRLSGRDPSVWKSGESDGT